ncbi:hypothetical protein ABID22_001536 [Pontibacter aydingkolensis]|uniref:Lipopolysaccharide biosynthesis protein n=1 Tax=Pontibacter aydingkolensis TaxID=1911536 RepID=A0ABS7CTS5_9BACT|nr:hypothetical protein [Pontibacter aydingkolensis]MBW7467210.1 hypothetical protein [Pontibacter aydingkolensis]
MQKDAVITLALNYEYKDLKVFLNSLNATGFDGVVFLIVNNRITPPLEAFRFSIEQVIIKGLKVDSIKYKLSIRELFTSFSRRRTSISIKDALSGSNFSDDEVLLKFARTYHCQLGRYAIYLLILQKNQFRKVFLTDSRDVFFQSNPFDNCQKGLHVFQENITQCIKDRWYNNQWVKLSTSYLNYLRIRNKGIFCSGTILGDHESTISFLKTFLLSVPENNLPFDIKGIDQGLFNVLIHTNKIQQPHIHSKQEHVLTLSALSKTDYSFDEDFIYNANGYKSAVVHQYDRCEDLVKFIVNKTESQKSF